MDDSPQHPPDGARGTGALSGDGSRARTLRHLSHDIRAAMSDVIGGLRLIDADRLDPQTQTQIDGIRSAADTLASLVDHALFAAAGESPLAHDTGPVALDLWLESLSQRWIGHAKDRGRIFRVVRNDPLPQSLRVPPVALTRVVGNLVGNALHHVPAGEVEVALSGSPSEGLVLKVQDEGPGFPEAVLKGEASGGMGTHAGSGLGLKIARDLSAAIGADLSFENTARGACATLRLGAHLVDGNGSSDDPAQPMPDLSHLRLLVAEDNLTNQTILGHMLSVMGAGAVFVADGRSALERLRAERFDIALLDIEMPEMSGLEVMEAVRSMGTEVAAMPLVAITAYVLRDNREAIYAAGADGIIGKPVSSAEDLGRAILRHAGSLEPEDVVAPLANDAKLLDHGRMYDLLAAAGADGRQELLERVEEDLTATLGLLDASMAEGDHAEIRAQTHILIAIAGALGAVRLCSMAEALNIAAKKRAVCRFGPLYAPLRVDLLALLEEVARRKGELGAGG